MTPAISVVMPVFNASRYLASAIESVRQQSFLDWELLCIDDGSTDGSLEIVKEFASRDPRIRLIACAHRGIVATLNEGVGLCRAEFIARLDADDLALPNRFQLQLDCLQRSPTLAMMCGAYQTIDANDRVWKTQIPPQSSAGIRVALQHSNCIAHSSVMMRRGVLESFQGPYRDYFPLAEDYDLWLRMAAGYEIGSSPELVLQYRRDLETTKPERIVQQTLSTLGVLLSNNFRSNGDPDRAIDWKQLDHVTLLSEGLSRPCIDRSIRRALFSEARLARKHGFKTQAVQLIEFATRYQPRHEGILPQLDFQWRRARARFAFL